MQRVRSPALQDYRKIRSVFRESPTEGGIESRRRLAPLGAPRLARGPARLAPSTHLDSPTPGVRKPHAHRPPSPRRPPGEWARRSFFFEPGGHRGRRGLRDCLIIRERILRGTVNTRSPRAELPPDVSVPTPRSRQLRNPISPMVFQQCMPGPGAARSTLRDASRRHRRRNPRTHRCLIR